MGHLVNSYCSNSRELICNLEVPKFCGGVTSAMNYRTQDYGIESVPHKNVDDTVNGISSPSPVRLRRDSHFVFPDLPFGSIPFDLTAVQAQRFTSCDYNETASNLPGTLETIPPTGPFYLGFSDWSRSAAVSEDPISDTEHTNTFDIDIIEDFSTTLLAGKSLTRASSFADRVRLTKELLQGLPTTFLGTISSPRASTLAPRSDSLSNLLQSSPSVRSGALEAAVKASLCVDSPSKQETRARSPEGESDMDLKPRCTKRRSKTQQKRVICVPISGDGKQRNEAPPSDLWAWRKYGQKPIKGSPYPRGYYRCSSSKGCSARKQVERSRTDPCTLVITYTSDHNHPWPVNRSSLPAGANRLGSTLQDNHRSHNGIDSDDHPENFFSSIINSNSADEHVVSSLESMQVEAGFSLQRDVDLCLSSSKTEDDFFDDLGELPELAAVFRKELLQEISSEEVKRANVDTHSIFGWASSSLLENKVMGCK